MPEKTESSGGLKITVVSIPDGLKSHEADRNNFQKGKTERVKSYARQHLEELD